MFVWSAMPEPWRSQMGSIDFAMKLLEEANVVVSPGRGFGETGEGCLRLALVENAQRLRQAVRQIGRCLRPAEHRLLISRAAIASIAIAVDSCTREAAMIDCAYCEKPLICDDCRTEYVPPSEGITRPSRSPTSS